MLIELFVVTGGGDPKTLYSIPHHSPCSLTSPHPSLPLAPPCPLSSCPSEVVGTLKSSMVVGTLKPSMVVGTLKPSIPCPCSPSPLTPPHPYLTLLAPLPLSCSHHPFTPSPLPHSLLSYLLPLVSCPTEVVGTLKPSITYPHLPHPSSPCP